MKRKILTLFLAVCAATCLCLGLSACDEEEHTHSYKSSVTTAATCTTDGVMTYTCSCGDSYTEAIPATGHTAVSANNGVEATCTKAGNESDTICSVCGETLSTGATISANGHTPAEAVRENEVAATCTEDGSYDSVVYCTVCKAEISRETKTIEAIGHNYENNVCTVCGDKSDNANTIAGTYYFYYSNGNAWEYGDGEDIVMRDDGTCCIDGRTEATYTVEGDVYVIVCEDGTAYAKIDGKTMWFLASKESVADLKNTVVFAYNGEEISAEDKTKIETLSGKEVPHTHSYKRTVTIEATCTTAGVMTYTCSCGDSYTEAIPAKGHTPAEAVKENEVAATCTTDGSHDNVIYCSVCKTEISRETKTEKATGHNYENGVCTVCKTLAPGLYDADNNLLATYEESGMDVTIDYSDEYICNYETAETSAYYVMKNKYPTAVNVVLPDSVTKIGVFAFVYCTSLKSITIPDGVTSIGDGAFGGCEFLTNITIPDSVTYIGNEAFDCCTSLKYNEYDNAYYLGNDSNPYVVLMDAKSNDIINCTINEKTKVIGEYAFYNCTSLTGINIPDGVTYIGYDAFYNCRSLTSIVIPDSVTSIGDSAFSGCSSLKYNEYDNAYYLGNDSNPYVVLVKAKSTDITSCTINEKTKFIHSSAFYYCTKLKSIIIPDSVISIGSYAFYECTSLLTSITIPDSVTSIGSSAFYNCTSLTSITVDGNNTNYKSIDGNLYSKDGTTLIQYAIGKTDASFIIPDGVTSIGEYAVYNCKNLTSIVIPNGVTSIGSSAFEDCTSLESIIIPDGVTSIGYAAFRNCTSLTSVTFENTEGWKVGSISISSADLADPATAAKYLTDTYCGGYWERS